MELKQNVWVYVEVADGKVSPLSAELLGKGRELADARNNTLVGLVVGDEKAAQDVISYGADAVVVVNNPELAAFDSVLYTKAVEEVAKNTNRALSSSARPITAAIWAAAYLPQ